MHTVGRVILQGGPGRGYRRLAGWESPVFARMSHLPRRWGRVDPGSGAHQLPLAILSSSQDPLARLWPVRLEYLVGSAPEYHLPIPAVEPPLRAVHVLIAVAEHPPLEKPPVGA